MRGGVLGWRAVAPQFLPRCADGEVAARGVVEQLGDGAERRPLEPGAGGDGQARPATTPTGWNAGDERSTSLPGSSRSC